MSVDRVNYLNIGLVLLSCALAFVVPFELFLFSYAVLGPLHYLTQISWLHKRRYFTRRASRFDYLFLGALAVSVPALARHVDPLGSFLPTITFVAFGTGLALILLESLHAKILGALGVLALAGVVRSWKHYGMTFDVFLPSIIHVFVFTAAFVLVGALKGRSLSGLVLLGVFGACAASFFVVVPDSSGVVVSEYVRESHASFAGLYNILSHYLLERPILGIENVYSTDAGFVIARFVAFCYTYHFLNWFSKTSIIRWHEVPRSWLAGCVVLWLASLGLYAYDYALGAAVLAYLSMIHVFLEFPLDHKTFLAIGQEAWSLGRGAVARGGRATAGAP